MRILLRSLIGEEFPDLVTCLTAQGNEVHLASNRNEALRLRGLEDYDVFLIIVDPMNQEFIAELENLSAAHPATRLVLLCTSANIGQLPKAVTKRTCAIHSLLEDPLVIAASVSDCLDHRGNPIHIATGHDGLHHNRLWKEMTRASPLTARLDGPEALMQTVIDAIPEVTILVDREHRILMANRAAREILGGDPVEQGLSCYQLLHGRGKPCSGHDHPCSLRRVVATKTPQSLTHTHYDRNGNEILVEVRAIPILDDAGEVVQMLESCHDVTEYHYLKTRVSAAEKAIEDHLLASHALVGVSAAIKKVRRLIAQGAPTDFTILILGESGVGKSLVANLIHQWSGRDGEGPCQVVNCPTIPEQLLESELFGYEKGAFTNALTRKPGRLEMAPSGTVFLDEIGLVPVSIQGKLLHVIENKEFMRLGGRKVTKLNARFVVATNADLPAMVRDGLFRNDLYYRLNEFPIYIPPLRERKEDIPVLAYHFLRSSLNGQHSRTIPESDMERLLEHEWPGNVRELRSVIERYAVTGELSGLESDDHKTPLSAGASSRSLSGLSEIGHIIPTRTLEVTEKEAILEALVMTRWNMRQTAANLGIGYGALRYRIDKYGLKGNHS